MTVNPNSLQCWIVTEGMAGTENQCIGVAESLGLEPVIKRVGLRQPWKSLSPWLGFENAGTFAPALTAPWPDILIAAGRKSIAASRYIKRMSGGKTLTVQLQDPRISPRHFDLVAVPEHDPTRGDNVIVTKGAPNRISEARLARARSDFAPLFAMMPAPRVAVLLGGNSKAHTMSTSGMCKLGEQLSSLNASLMITASRRTGEAEKQAFLEALHASESSYPRWFWDGSGENPYMGMLAWADTILVTADSVSMISDAATAGKPVYMIPLDGGSRRFDSFHRNMIQYGALRPFEGALEHWNYPPLRDSDAIAAAIRTALESRTIGEKAANPLYP